MAKKELSIIEVFWGAGAGVAVGAGLIATTIIWRDGYDHLGLGGHAYLIVLALGILIIGVCLFRLIKAMSSRL